MIPGILRLAASSVILLATFAVGATVNTVTIDTASKPIKYNNMIFEFGK